MVTVETHPFGVFSPPNAKYLLLGSFVAVKQDDTYDWFYGSKRNQFWPLIEEVYSAKLPNKDSRQNLFTKLSIAIADMIHQCERRDGNSMDSNLINLVYNTDGLKKLLQENPIKKIFFSSRFVENEFKKKFTELIQLYPAIELITLPSPSPRYAAMSKQEKIKKYRELLPKLEI